MKAIGTAAGNTLHRSVVGWACLLLSAAVASFSPAPKAAAADVTFQGRVYRVTVLRPLDENGVILSTADLAGRDLVFVHLADGRRFLQLPAAGKRACFTGLGNTADDRHVFFLLNLTNGTVEVRSSIAGRLLNLDGTTADASTIETPLIKWYNIPVDLLTNGTPTDVCAVDKDYLALRTDGTKPDDERVYIISRQQVSAIQSWFKVTLKDADDANGHAAVFVEYDPETGNFLAVQPSLPTGVNTDTTDRIEAWSRTEIGTGNIGTFKDRLDLDGNTAFDYVEGTKVIHYGGTALGLTLDPETGTVYQLDAASRTIYVLTPREPSLDSITPAEGSTKGGTTVTLRGVLFPADAQVFFGGVPATTVEVKSSARIVAVTPAHTAGAVNVTVVGTGLPADAPLQLTAGFLYADAAPVAALTASPTEGLPPLTVSFDVAGTLDSDGTVVSRVLLFGDGSSYSFPADDTHTISHVYATRGVYTAVLTATDDEGGTAEATVKIYVGTGGDDFFGKTVLGRMKLRVGLSDGHRDRLALRGELELPEEETDLAQATVEILVGQAHYTGKTDAKERIRDKAARFFLRKVRRRGTAAGTRRFTFRWRGTPLKDDLAATGVDLTQNGTAVLNVVVRFTDHRGRLLTYTNEAVLKVISRNGKTAVLRRR